MDGLQRASQCRQRIVEGVALLARLAQGLQGRGGMIRASPYRYRRRCGAPGCRCRKGELHEGQALSVSQGGGSRVVSLSEMDFGELERQVDAYRQWRRARAEMVQGFQEVLRAVDELGRLRTVPVERLRRPEGRGT